MMTRVSDMAALLPWIRNARAVRLAASAREHMGPYIKGLRRHQEAQVGEEELALRALLGEFRVLDRTQKDRTALRLADLWESFQDHFGGIEGFLSGNEQKRAAYLNQIQVLESRAAAFKAGEEAQYYFATAMMLAYLKLWTQSERPPEAIDLSVSVTELIEAGRAGRKGIKEAA